MDVWMDDGVCPAQGKSVSEKNRGKLERKTKRIQKDLMTLHLIYIKRHHVNTLVKDLSFPPYTYLRMRTVQCLLKCQPLSLSLVLNDLCCCALQLESRH